MGSFLVEFGNRESGMEAFFHSGRIEVDSGRLGFHFSSFRGEEEKLRQSCLALQFQEKSAFLPDLSGTLILIWKESTGLFVSGSGTHEDIPSIEEMSGVGNLQEFLGAVLSVRDRLKRGARAY